MQKHPTSRDASPRSRSGGGRRPQRLRPLASAQTTRSDLFSVQDRRHHHKVMQATQQRRARLLPLAARDVATRQYLYTHEANTILDEGAVTKRAKDRENRLERQTARQSTTTNNKPASGRMRVQFRSSPSNSVTSSTAGSTSLSGAVPLPEAPSLTELLRTAAENRYTHADAAVVEPSVQDGSANTESQTTARPASAGHVDSISDDGAADWLDQDAPPIKEMDFDSWMEAGCPTGCWKDLLENELYGPERAERSYYALKYRPERT